MPQPTTTIAKIHAECSYSAGYRKLLKALGGARAYGRNAPITVRQIVDACGIEYAALFLKTMPEHDKLWRLYGTRCARRVQHLFNDPRSLNALDVAERYALGKATDAELKEAQSEAETAIVNNGFYDPLEYGRWIAYWLSRPVAHKFIPSIVNRVAKVASLDGRNAEEEMELMSQELIRMCCEA